ncbi:MAG: tetratricopeptide repeat protein, partial [Pseudomonadota bacterium]
DAHARAHAHRILELEPHNYSARVLLTRLHVASEAYVEAEQTVLGLLADYPESPELFALYADIMLQTFHIDKAEKLAAEALRFDPDNLSAMSIHAQCAFIRQPDAEQTARMQRLLKEHPDQAQTTILLVQRLLDNGKTSEAYRLSRSLVMSQPDNPHYVELANNLRFTNHWTMKPLWPVIKWGWGGSIAIWLVFMLYMKSGVLAEYQGTVALVFLGFVIYSWVWPWLLKRIMGIQ